MFSTPYSRGPIPVTPTKPLFEVAEVFRRYGPEYRRTHSVPLAHHKVMCDIERCRTAALGGHVDECNHCGEQQISYNSCRNRHCPKCQGTARARWVAARQAELLPVEYFHVVFTLPEQLHPLMKYNQRLLLHLLFQAASQTLLEFGERHWGGELGVTAVLHTWGQTMSEHPHLHCIVTGGALSKDRQRWRSCRRGYLFPVRALSAVFRAKYCAALAKAQAQGALRGTAAFAWLASAESFRAYLQSVARQAFVVYAKRPMNGPAEVIKYLGRYTHRVAITNHRLVAIDGGRVSFVWKDYRDGERQKVMTLEAGEFIRRFLLHVLPAEFVRIRHYGLLAHEKWAKLARCRELLRVEELEWTSAAPPVAAAQTEEMAAPWVCSRCGVGELVRQVEWSAGAGPPEVRWVPRCAA